MESPLPNTDASSTCTTTQVESIDVDRRVSVHVPPEFEVPPVSESYHEKGEGSFTRAPEAGPPVLATVQEPEKHPVLIVSEPVRSPDQRKRSSLLDEIVARQGVPVRSASIATERPSSKNVNPRIQRPMSGQEILVLALQARRSYLQDVDEQQETVVESRALAEDDDPDWK